MIKIYSLYNIFLILRMFEDSWIFLVKIYCLLMVGSIDRIDIELYDYGIIRVLFFLYKLNKDVVGDLNLIVFVFCLNFKIDEDILEL